MSTRKNPHAVALGRKRWRKLSDEEMAAQQSANVAARWEKTSEEELRKLGTKLADARAAARKEREKK